MKEEIRNIKGLHWACIDCFEKQIHDLTDSERRILFGENGEWKPQIKIGIWACFCSKGHVISFE